MISWEERMSASARERDRIRWETEEKKEKEFHAIENTRQAVQQAIQAVQQAIDEQEDLESGPPDSCPSWSWGETWSHYPDYRITYGWVHGEPDEKYSHPEDWCRNPAHSEPLYCGLIAIGAS